MLYSIRAVSFRRHGDLGYSLRISRDRILADDHLRGWRCTECRGLMRHRVAKLVVNVSFNCYVLCDHDLTFRYLLTGNRRRINIYLGIQ